MQPQSVLAEIEKYRGDPSNNRWELPAWGHPIAQGILPLFITFDDRLFPVGTAFTIGRGGVFVISAAHNIYQAWKHEERLSHLLVARELPKSVDIKQAGISVLYHRLNEANQIDFAIWSLETVDGAPPTDVVFGYPRFQTDFPTLAHRLSFDLPFIGERIWSIGYSEFFPKEDGIPLAAVRNGTFDWRHNYSHKLVVVEGFVEHIFTQKFASGYVEGPCFTFDAEISHAQSGGPVISPQGFVRGINSAGASRFFDKPMSLASLLYPLLTIQLRFGVTIGPVRLNASRPLLDLIAQGTISTDGSEERVGICQDEATGSLRVSPRYERAMSNHLYDDFSAFQDGRKATVETQPVFHLRKNDFTKS